MVEQVAAMNPRLNVATGLAGQRITRMLLAGLVVLPILGHLYNWQRYGRLIRLTDEYMYYAHARSWYFDGDCEYGNDFLMAPGFELGGHYAAIKTPTGYTKNYFNCGTAMISLPFLAIADGLTRLHNQLAADPLPRDGYSAYYQFIVPLGHVLLAIGGLLAACAVAARYFPPPAAAAAALAVLIGTNAYYYIAIEPTHSHAGSITCVGLLVYFSDTMRHHGITLGRCAWMGLVAGLMVVTRPQDAMWGIIPAVLVLPAWVRMVVRERRIGRGLACAGVTVVIAMLCYVPQAVVNWRLFGEPIRNTYATVMLGGEPAVLHWTEPEFAKALIYPTTGILWTSPLALLGIAGTLGLLGRKEPTLRTMAVAFVAVYYMVACVWWVFSGFGHRYLTSCTVVYVFGMCLLLMWASRRRWRAAVLSMLVAFGVVWQCGLLLAVDRGWWTLGRPSPLYTFFFNTP